MRGNDRARSLSAGARRGRRASNHRDSPRGGVAAHRGDRCREVAPTRARRTAELYRLARNTDAARRELTEAHRLFAEMGATGTRHASPGRSPGELLRVRARQPGGESFLRRVRRPARRRRSSRCFDVVLCHFGTNVSDLDRHQDGGPDRAGDFGGESSSSSSSSGRGSNDRRSASRPATANEATINTGRTRPM
jgi:hypothetical protein